ncbi:MAG: TonB-dependent receptor [Calditrichaeota bacterium]|nr:MAG: TonB-dependent receptor [Calditrichota bacterium]
MSERFGKKNEMKTFLLTFIIMSFMALRLSAQKINPQTEIELPSDSTGSVRGDLKPEPKNPDLELPDVLILGQDRSHRIINDKKNLTPETPALTAIRSEYSSDWTGLDEGKPSFAADSLNKSQTWGSLTGGTVYTFSGAAGHRRPIPEDDMLISGWVNRSEGQFANSKYAHLGLNGKVGYRLDERTMMMARGVVQRSFYGMMQNGYRRQDSKRQMVGGKLSADIFHDFNAITDGSAGLEIGGLSLAGDTTGSTADENSNFLMHFRLGLNSQYRKSQLIFKANYLRETNDSDADTLTQAGRMGRLGFEWLYPFSSKMTAAAGINYASFAHDDSSAISRFSPFARLNFIPSPPLGITLLLSSGLQYTPFSELWRQNQYLAHNIPFDPTDEKIGVKIKVETQPSKMVRLRASAQKQWMNSLYFWQADTTTWLITRDHLNDIEISEIELGAVIELTNSVQFYISYIDYSDQGISAGPQGEPSSYKIPYRPDFYLPIRADITLLHDLNLGIRAELWGARKKRLGGEEQLPSVFLVNIDAQKPLGQHVTALVSIHNLFNTSYSQWENYPEMRFIFSAGVRVVF